MANTTSDIYYKAFKGSYENLVKALPIEPLIPALYSKQIISSGLKTEIDGITTNSKKVEHLLTNIENGLKVKVTEQFEGLLQVMEEYSQQEESIVVKKLVEEIRSSISLAQSPGVTRSLKGLEVPMSTQNTAVKVHNLPLIQVLHNEELGISVYELGNLIPGRPFIEKVLMLLGATGAGKTTLINRMVNYIYGVQWDDDFRFQLISEKIAKSQTLVTIYTIHPSLESHFPHTLTIVDTPGFSDAKHDQIFQQIKEIFSNTLQGKKGIDHLDGIGFVIQSSSVSLTIEQRMFDSVMSIFGNDITNNIFMMVTFADASKPPVMTAIEEANIKFKKLFKFNNSALYVNNSSRCESQEYDFNSIFWKLGINSFKYFLENLCDVEQVSLCLTKEELRKRKHLEVAHQAVRQQIDMGVTTLEELKQDILHQREANLTGNKDFSWQVLATQVDNSPNVYSINCSLCEYTCHAECTAPDIYDCSSMDSGGEDAARCQHCPQRCSWKDHKRSSYQYKIYEEETRISQEMQRKFNYSPMQILAVIDNPVGVYSTNCPGCKFTCHLKCQANITISNCSSMYPTGTDNAHCQYCNHQCSWRNHEWNTYHYSHHIKQLQETAAFQELQANDSPWQFIFRQVDNPSNVYSINCSTCKYTCHVRCNAPDIHNCSSMDDGGKEAACCQHCPQRCSWRDHKQSSCHYKIYIQQETTASQELSKFKDFPWQFLFRQVDNPPNIHSTNCSQCKRTCHAECNAPDIYNCSSMDNGGKDAAHCQYCECSWRDHKWSSYHYKIYIEQETTASQEFKDFPWQFRQVVNPPNVYSTNCSLCEYTCHTECTAPDIYDCSSMDSGGEDAARCQHCPQKCSWRDHKRSSYQYKMYKQEVSQESQINKAFPQQVLIRMVNNPVGEYSTNCSRCQHTCHRVCNATDIYGCSSMDKSTRFTKATHCDVCPWKCSWRDHKRSTYHYQVYIEETMAPQELQRKLVSDLESKEFQAHQKEHLLKKAEEELTLKIENILDIMKQLDEKIPKKSSVMQTQYLDFLIAQEKKLEKQGYQQRVQIYEKFKQEQNE